MPGRLAPPSAGSPCNGMNSGPGPRPYQSLPRALYKVYTTPRFTEAQAVGPFPVSPLRAVPPGDPIGEWTRPFGADRAKLFP